MFCRSEGETNKQQIWGSLLPNENKERDYYETIISSHLRRDVDCRLCSSTNNVLVADDELESVIRTHVSVDLDDVSGYKQDTEHDRNRDRVHTRVVDYN